MTRSISAAALSTVSSPWACVTSAVMRAKWPKSPSPSVWWVARPAACVAVAGEPTTWITGTCSAYAPAIALIALSSPTPNVVHTAPRPRMRA